MCISIGCPARGETLALYSIIYWAPLKTPLLGFERIFCPNNAF